MKRVVHVIIVASIILSSSYTVEALPPPCIECAPEVAFQSRFLLVPFFMLVISCDFDVAFDQNSEVKIFSDEIIKMGQIYISKEAILTITLILPAGFETRSTEKNVLVEVSTRNGYVGTSLRLINQ